MPPQTGRGRRRKGFQFERDVVNAAKEMGLEAQRAYASDGRSIGQSEKVDLVIEGICVQAKRIAKVNKVLQIPEGCDCVAFQEDRGQKLMLLRMDDFLDLLKGAIYDE